MRLFFIISVNISDNYIRISSVKLVEQLNINEVLSVFSFRRPQFEGLAQSESLTNCSNWN